MKNAAFYGIAIALVGAGFTLVLYILGFQTDKMEIGQWLGWFGLVIPIIGIVLGLREVKEDAVDENKALTYGGAVRQALLMVLFWALGGAVFAYIYYGWINTEMVDYVIATQQEQLAERGVPESQWEGIESFTRTLFKPWLQAIIAGVAAAVMGLIISLIAAAFFRHEPKPRYHVTDDTET